MANDNNGEDIGDDNQQQQDYSDNNSNSNSNTSNNHFTQLFNNMIDPLQFSTFLFIVLLLFVIYLLLPRGIRKQYFYAHPKRHAWMARNNSNNNNNSSTSSSTRSLQQQQQQKHMASTPLGLQSSMETGSYTGGSSIIGSGTAFTAGSASAVLLATGQQQQQQQQQISPMMGLTAAGSPLMDAHGNLTSPYGGNANNNSNENNEIVISAAMQQLRDPGVLIVAHGSRGKPKTVRLSLTESSITWRTETRKLLPTNVNSKQQQQQMVPKMGKLHSVPLAHIMYVDVGKQTTALRRVENASVPDVLCFSLLTKEGSLDLEAASARERDALVSCFSLVLDEVHSAQNWRDIYRGPSSDMPSSFDEFDQQK